MNKEYKCAICGSIAKDTPGACCGAERKEQDHNHEEGHNDGDEHDHHASICSACSGKENHTHTCGM
jgi:hypothetical protein